MRLRKRSFPQYNMGLPGIGERPLEVCSKIMQQGDVIFLQQYLAVRRQAQMADSWMDPGLCICQARSTDRGKRIKNVFAGLSWRRREMEGTRRASEGRLNEIKA